MHIGLLRQIENGSGGSVLSGTQNTKLKKKHNKRQTDSSGTFVLEAFIQKTLMIYISYHICILYMCHVWFLSFLGTTDVNNYLHICIVLFEVSRAIFSTYFLYYVVMMLWYVLTLFEIKKKKHLSIQAWVRVMLVSVVNIIHWYYLFLTCDILLGYIEKTKIDEKKKIWEKPKPDKRSCYSVPFVKPCRCCDSAERESGCTASRLKGWGNIFVTECKHSEGGKKKETSYEGTASFYQNVSKKIQKMKTR